MAGDDDDCDWRGGKDSRSGGSLTCNVPGGQGALPIVIFPAGSPTAGGSGSYLSSDVDPAMPYKATPAPQKLDCQMSHYAAQPQKYPVNFMNAYGYVDA
jgi:hypothetical protein